MAVVDQKLRYRRQAALCYELAAQMTRAKAASMIRLGDTYSVLALNPDRVPPHSSVGTEESRDPHCKKCSRKMQLTHSLPRTRVLPAMQAFRCDPCGETLIWKGADLSRADEPQGPAFLSEGDRWMTRYVAVSFRRTGTDFVPGPAIECPDAGLAIQRAELMMREERVAGAIAFSRRRSTSRVAKEAVILEIFGEIPDDFDIA